MSQNVGIANVGGLACISLIIRSLAVYMESGVGNPYVFIISSDLNTTRNLLITNYFSTRVSLAFRMRT